jgi:antitoxin ParD1/3/4
MAEEQQNKDKMTSMNVSLPESLRSFVEAQVATGYGTVSEYIRELVREDRKKKAQARLEELLLEGLDSGQGEVVSSKVFQELKKEFVARAAKGLDR